MNSFFGDIRHATRTLRRTPGFTLVVVMTLTLGIGSTVAMFSVLEAALGKGLPFPESERLVLGRATINSNLNPMASFPDYLDYRERNTSFESLGAVLAFTIDQINTAGDAPEEVVASIATREFFQTLDVSPQIGRLFSPEEAVPGGPTTAVLSHGYWQRAHGADPNILGEDLVLNGTPATIIGVMPPEFHFFFDVDLWIAGFDGGPMTGVRRYHNWFLVGRLRPGAVLEEAQSELDVISAQLAEAFPDSNTGKAIRLDTLRSALVEDYASLLFLLSGAILLVLLIASANVAGLLLSSGSARSSEIAVRLALGARRVRIIRQLLTESLVLAFCSGILGVLSALWIQDLILGFASMERLGLREMGISWPMLLFALGISLSSIFLFGLAPALRLSKSDSNEELKEGGRSGGLKKGPRLRPALVIVQVALSTILLLCSGLLLRSFVRLISVDPGFETENLFTAGIQLPRAEFGETTDRVLLYENLVEGLVNRPGVEAVGLADRLPIRTPGNNVRVWDPENPPTDTDPKYWAYQRRAFPGYFEAMGIPLLSGRDFHRSDGNSEIPLIILSQMAADSTFPGQDPLGRTVAVDRGGDEPVFFQVVGVAGDLRMSSLGSSARLSMYYSYHQAPLRNMEVAIRTRSDTDNPLRALQDVLWGLNGDVPVIAPGTMNQVLSNSVSGSRSFSTLLGAFAVVAAFLAVLGLYGVLAHMVNKSTREIGVRVALGASTGAVLGLIVGRGMRMALLGLAIGVAGALGAGRLLERFLPLFQTDPTDPWAFLGVAILLSVVGFLACLVPGFRASRIDPVEAFRAE